MIKRCRETYGDQGEGAEDLDEENVNVEVRGSVATRKGSVGRYYVREHRKRGGGGGDGGVYGWYDSSGTDYWCY